MIVRPAVLVLSGLLAACGGPADETASRPNFLLVVADDMGYTDLGDTTDLSMRNPGVLQEMVAAFERYRVERNYIDRQASDE